MTAIIDRSTFCRGDGGTCECERFLPDAEGNPRCFECGHGISKHPGAADFVVNRDPPVPRPQPDPPPFPPAAPAATILSQPRPVMIPTAASATNSAGPSKVQDIFASLTESRSQTWTQMPTASGARAEVLAGFNGTKKQKGSCSELSNAVIGPRKVSTTRGSGSGRSRIPSPSTQISSTSAVFHVSSVAILVCGIDSDGQLKRPKVPTGKTYGSVIQAMRNRGCFIGSTGPGTKGGIAVNSAWPFADVDKQVRAWFPQVFTYLASIQKKPSPSQSSQRPEWLVGVRCGTTFSIVEVAEPNGSTLFENKGRGKAGVAESSLWFLTRKTIPDKVYDSWNKQSHIVGSDSDVEPDLATSDSDAVADDSRDGGATDVISLSGSDLDDKLTSSMHDLGLDSDGANVVASKDKGKGLMKTAQKTPPRQPVKRSHRLRSPLQSPPAAKKQKNTSSKSTPLFLRSPPRVSSAPSLVPVSEDDVILRGRHFPDSPKASPIVNPWESTYTLIPFTEFHSLYLAQ